MDFPKIKNIRRLNAPDGICRLCFGGRGNDGSGRKPADTVVILESFQGNEGDGIFRVHDLCMAALSPKVDVRTNRLALRLVYQPMTQVVYLPGHIPESEIGNFDNPYVQYGFVTSPSRIDGSVYCRYWSDPRKFELRTIANGELIDIGLLRFYESVPESSVRYIWMKYVAGSPSSTEALDLAIRNGWI